MAGPGAHVASRHGGSASITHRHQAGELAAASMFELHRSAWRIGQVPIAPLHQPDDDRVEVDPLGGEVILEARRVGLVGALFDKTGGHQTLEAGRQNIARDTEMVVHLIEAMDAQEQLAEDEQAPHVAEHAERACDRAGGAIDERIGSGHAAGSLA